MNRNMLGSNAVSKCNRVVNGSHGQIQRSPHVQRTSNRNTDHRRVRTMLRLRIEVGLHEFNIRRFIRDHHQLRRSRGHVDADRADELRLCRGHVLISRTDDLVDARQRLRSERRRRDPRRAAALIDRADAESRTGVVQFVARGGGRRRDHDQFAHAGDARRNRAHDERGEVHRAPAGNVDSDAP